MKSNRVFFFFALLLTIGSLSADTTHSKSPMQDATKTQEPQLPEAEANAANAVSKAPDMAGKLVAAEAFIKKYPKSSVRAKLADYLVGQIDSGTDATQKLAHAETFQRVFTAETEKAAIQPVVILAYVQAKRVDEAFALAERVLAKDPENIRVLAHMAMTGTDEAKRQNMKHAAQTRQYGLKAIELLEANRKPATVDDTLWNGYKESLPRLYQSIGVMALVSGNQADAKAHLQKSATLDPTDPFNYVLIGSMVNDEYQQLAQSYKGMPEGPQKQETLKKATELLDKVIDLYARAVGASQGKQEYQALHVQVLQDLTPYYKYRHNGSVEGLQQLIDKYKPTPKP